MTITRKFLDWRRSAIESAAEHLLERFATDERWDLDQVVVVVPGSRAGRRLLEYLIWVAEKRSLIFFPPQITTVGRLPEMLYESKRPFAAQMVQLLAWVRALREAPRDQLARFIPELPAADDVARWMDLGELLWRQHRELAADAMSFSDVMEIGQRMPNFKEHARWQLLSDVQHRYLEILDELGLWDLQSARLFAIQHGECRTSREIVLLGTADMNRAMRFMLDQVSGRVEALIHAPQHIAGRFDKYGCIDPSSWQSTNINLDAQQVRVVDGPLEVATEVARQLDRYDGRYRADQIAIGIPDDRLPPFVHRQLQQAGVASRWVVGAKLADSSPYRLLQAISNYVGRRRFPDFAALVRHPDLFDWVERQLNKAVANGQLDNVPPDWLSQLDRYHARHLQPRLGFWLGAPDSYRSLELLHEAVEAALAPLLRGKQPLMQWAIVLADLLSTMYEGVDVDRSQEVGQVTCRAFQRIREVLLEFSEIPESLAPSLTATQAIQLLMETLQSDHVAAPADSESIEMLGWLELPLDQSPALIVTSMNERFVPKSANSDLFLPNGLRQRLGLLDNARRYARDAYALSVLVASREDLTLIVARRDTQGDPLVPSRLLFAASPETIAERVRLFFGGPSKEQPERIRTTDDEDSSQITANVEAGNSRDFVVPRPRDLQVPVTSMSVTSFRTYLACPYRFYLRHVLRLGREDDRGIELDAAAFGNLIHEVLCRFGRSDVSQATDVGDIRSFLRRELGECVQQWYGRDLLPAVNVQTMQAQVRLDAFAEWQADWASEGWRIRYTEVPEPGTVTRINAPDGRSMMLHGRLDRLDQHQETGEWFVFDYKTSTVARGPSTTHQRSGKWVDLQLPLYRHLAGSLEIEGRPRLGYINLPADTSKLGHWEAEWSEKDLEGADKLAGEIVGQILDGEFWPPAYPPPAFSDDYAAICQDDVFERRLDATEVA